MKTDQELVIIDQLMEDINELCEDYVNTTDLKETSVAGCLYLLHLAWKNNQRENENFIAN